jgi:N-acetylglucosamine-6-phosphate deacetylase
MESGSQGVRRIARAQLRYGTTAFLPSTIAARHDELLRAIADVTAAEHDPEPGAEILGIHVEGPYINLKYKGAQPVEGIRDPDEAECRELLAAAPGRLKIMTLAPELPGGLDLIRMLTAEGVIASLGHSEADYDMALAAIEAGATHATHLYNAMSGLHHRKPGLAAACLNEPGIRAEIICDGVHVHPRMIRLAVEAKGARGLAVITDSTAAQGCSDGLYQLGGFQIQVRGPLCTLMDGVTLAGSVLTMNRAVRNAIAFAGVSHVEAAYMAALLPAEICGAAGRKGSLEAGKEADIAVFNPDFSVRCTVRAGEVAYTAGQ